MQSIMDDACHDRDPLNMDSFVKLEIGPLNLLVDEVEALDSMGGGLPYNDDDHGSREEEMKFSSHPSDAGSSSSSVEGIAHKSHAAGEPLRGSPTRVLDFHLYNDRKEHSAKEQRQGCFPPPALNKGERFDKTTRTNNCQNIHRQLLTPPIISRGQPVLHRRRRRLSYFVSLPTLNETSSSDEGGSSFEEGEENVNPARRSRGGRSSDMSGVKIAAAKESGSAAAAPPSKHGGTRKSSGGHHGRTSSHRERLQEMQDAAAALAHSGAEEEALSVYKKALHLTRNEVSRIKLQLRQVEGLHPSTLKSVNTRLHEDWLQVGVAIAKIRTMMAVLHERLGDYDRAIHCCKEAREVYQRQAAFVGKRKRGDSSGGEEGLDEIQELIQQMDLMTEKVGMAKSSAADRKSRHEDIALLRKMIEASDDKEQKHDLVQKAEGILRAVRRIEVGILGEGHPRVADTESIASALALERGNHKQALKMAMRALSITKTSLGMQHPRTGEKLLQVARLYASQPPPPPSSQNTTAGGDESAVDYFSRAVEVFRESGRRQHLVGSTLGEIAVIRMRRREYEPAVLVLKDSLNAYECMDAEELNPEINVEKILVSRNLGDCYSHLKDYKNALEPYLTALEMQRCTRKTRETLSYQSSSSLSSSSGASVDSRNCEEDLASDESIADTLRRLGKAYAGTSNHQRALVMYKEALMIYRSAVVQAMRVAKGRANPELPAKQDQLAHCLYCIAEVQDSTGDLDEAVRIYSESLQLRLFSDAHKQDRRSNMVHCAMCLSGIGNVHIKRREYEEAKKVFKDALTYCEAHGVPGNHWIVVMINKRLKEAEEDLPQNNKDEEEESKESDRSHLEHLEIKADAEIARSDIDAAIVTLTEVMSHRKATLKELKAAGEDQASVKHDTASTLKKFGRILLLKGDGENASRAYKDALKLYKQSGTSPDAPEVREARAEFAKLRV